MIWIITKKKLLIIYNFAIFAGKCSNDTHTSLKEYTIRKNLYTRVSNVRCQYFQKYIFLETG